MEMAPTRRVMLGWLIANMITQNTRLGKLLEGKISIMIILGVHA
jgi:hypothetical protein